MGPKKKEPVKSPPSGRKPGATSPSDSSDDKEKAPAKTGAKSPALSHNSKTPPAAEKEDIKAEKSDSAKEEKSQPSKAEKDTAAKTDKANKGKKTKSDSGAQSESNDAEACSSDQPKCGKQKQCDRRGFWASLCCCGSKCCQCSACCQDEAVSKKYEKEDDSEGKVHFDAVICESPKETKKDDAKEPLVKPESPRRGSTAAAAKKAHRRK